MKKIDWNDIFTIRAVKVDSFYGTVERHGFVHQDKGGWYVEDVKVNYDLFPRNTIVDGSCIIHDDYTDLDIRIWFVRNNEDGLSVHGWEVI